MLLNTSDARKSWDMNRISVLLSQQVLLRYGACCGTTIPDQRDVHTDSHERHHQVWWGGRKVEKLQSRQMRDSVLLSSFAYLLL